ncbi:MAG: DUF6115 domain-containing protein [Lachnospiraceae bacterium]|nr:DUF6115 domain-containing protein [Lachnospiraceae bacterium]
MTALEVTLIIVGIIFVIVSFFIEEKLSQKDIDRIVSLSENELKVIVDRQLRGAEGEIEDSIAESLEEAHEATKRAMEKETNEKIMAISEYSDTVLESMNKTHNEILFLYSMLGDKHTELTELAGQLGQFSEKMKNTEDEVLHNLAEAARELETNMSAHEPINQDEAVRQAVEAEEEGNHNDEILERHQAGMSDVEIAKELGLGLGEVKLVIGLYKGEQAGAV